MYDGYFVAPVSARYRFFISCDDACDLYLSTTPSDSTTAELIASRNGYSDWREYLNGYEGGNAENSFVSDWVTLVEYEAYYILGHFSENSGGDHFTVSVEIETTAPDNHPQAGKEI